MAVFTIRAPIVLTDERTKEKLIVSIAGYPCLWKKTETICDLCYKNMVSVQNRNFTGRDFLNLIISFSCLTCSLVLLATMSLVRSRIDSECGTFFWNFSILGYEGDRCLSFMFKCLPQKHGYRPKTIFFINLIWTLVDLFYNSYSLLISLRNMVEKCKMHFYHKRTHGK